MPVAGGIAVRGECRCAGKHPYYLHALTDLRIARWMLEHRPGDAAVSGQEDVAITEIVAAIGEIERASIKDGKDIHDHPKVDVPKDRLGWLQRALELLLKTMMMWRGKRTTR